MNLNTFFLKLNSDVALCFVGQHVWFTIPNDWVNQKASWIKMSM